MSYASVSDIESDIKGISFSDITSINQTQVEAFIEQESAIIDQYVGAQYVTPVTNAAPLLVLKKICIDFVVFRVRKILRENENIPDNNQIQGVSEAKAYNDSMSLLKAISKGDISLQGAERAAGKSEIFGFKPPKTLTENVFKKDQVQW